MSKTTNRFSPEVRARAVRLVLDHEKEHSSRWAAVFSTAAKIGCTVQSRNGWVKKAEVDGGMRLTKVKADGALAEVESEEGQRTRLHNRFDESVAIWRVT